MGLREAYQEKAFAQLCEWQAWIEHIKNDRTVYHERGQVERQRLISHLEDCHRIAQTRLEELRSAQAGRWELAKHAVERAMIDLKQALDKSGSTRRERLVRLQDSREAAIFPFDRKG